MNAKHLPTPSTLEDAEAKMRAAAGALLPLVSATMHALFPTGAFLVLTRSGSFGDYDELRLDSVRGSTGETLWESGGMPGGYEPFPGVVPAELAELWEGQDPTDPDTVLDLVRRIDHAAPDEYLAFLPAEFLRAGEDDGERTPLGVPVALVLEQPVCPVCGDEGCQGRTAPPGAYCALCHFTHDYHRYVECATFTTN
ncbi:hypothetical protein ABZV52_30040 [Streptomyces sp. NPDC004735]|uniref:hypothetical protein n=1 Tax=Streptomyces sp. NPDC004735 TaxID=3156654 RepID=UPI0033BB68F8